jgi:DNA-binding Xre family transcriptional regulator
MLKKLAMIQWEQLDEGGNMISYKPFYRTLIKKGLTEYQLIYKFGVSSNTLYRMKHGKAITTSTLDTLCFYLDCNVEDVIEIP